MEMDIINKNFAVQSFFDDIPVGISSKKYLSKEGANSLLKLKKPNYYTSHKVIECLAIVAIIPFNSSIAYVFNKAIPYSECLDKVSITSDVYENLMDCYVFKSSRISKQALRVLESEYHSRGGEIYGSYYCFEENILKVIRKERCKRFINTIVFDSIFKHGFREVKKLTWSNGTVKIVRKKIQRSSISFPSNLKHTEFDIDIKNKMLIGSIFGKYYKYINQLSPNTFGVVCSTNDSHRYNFAYFEIILN